VPTEFGVIFPEVKMPSNHLDAGQSRLHPYPDVLEGVLELDQWRTIWEQNARSTPDHSFFPPMLPSSYFDNRNPRYEFRRDWDPHSPEFPKPSTPFGEGHGCVLVRGNGQQLIGAASWRWWGIYERVSGVGFNIYLRTPQGWLWVSMDVRPTHYLPTYGPDIYREGEGDDGARIKRCLEELIQLGPRTYPYE
jgi:hypothetical protein